MDNSHYSSGETRLSPSVVNSVKSADSLEKSLSAGSKRRLIDYRRNLAKSRGLDKPLFDDKALQVILKYALDRKEVLRQVDYLNHLQDDQGFAFSRNLKIYSKIEDNLINFKGVDHPSFRWNQNYQKALKDVRSVFQKVHLKPLVFNTDDDIRDALPKENTHSGFRWILSGRKLKGENMEGIQRLFEKEKSAALHNGTFNSPILCAFRTQASGEYDDDGSQTGTCKHKTRLVSMYDLVSIVNELQYSVPFQSLIAQQDFYAGGKDEHEISSIIMRWRVAYKRFFSIDYSSFDSTISSWLIEDAFAIIKDCFKLDDEQSALFDIMVHDFIHKTFVLTEGLLSCHRGVPSGSMWTQIIDSIVNAIVIKTYFNAMHQRCNMIIMGDDNCIFTNYDTTIDVLATYISKNFGLIVKVEDKSSFGSTKNKEGIKFLSRYWRFDGQYRHPNLLLSRILFPERFRPYSSEVTPEMVVFAFILTYGIGMRYLIDCRKFLLENRISKRDLLDRVDSRYLPGSLAYIKEYTRRRNVA